MSSPSQASHRSACVLRDIDELHSAQLGDQLLLDRRHGAATSKFSLGIEAVGAGVVWKLPGVGGSLGLNGPTPRTLGIPSLLGRCSSDVPLIPWSLFPAGVIAGRGGDWRGGWRASDELSLAGRGGVVGAGRRDR